MSSKLTVYGSLPEKLDGSNVRNVGEVSCVNSEVTFPEEASHNLKAMLTVKHLLEVGKK